MSQALPSLATLDAFHEMIDSVHAIDVSLDCDLNTLAESREIVRQRIVDRERELDPENTVASTPDWTAGLPTSYTDALSVFDTSRDAELALNRLTIESKVNSELTGVVRSSWIYLAAMLLLASGGIAVFAFFSVPAIEAMKADMALSPQHRFRPSPPWHQHAWPIAIGLAAASLGLMIAATFTHFPAWSAGCLGGKQYRRFRLGTIESEVGYSLAMVADEPIKQSFRDLFARDYSRTQAIAQLSRLRVIVPVILIVFVGGVGVMAYCWMLFSPLVALIYDLSATSPSGVTTR